MKGKYKISVVVPVYNAEKYLDRCVESVILQDYENWELLLIDDGSMDQSGNICDKYGEEERIVVIHQKNQGVSVARNRGLQLATGEYVIFLDADDWIERNLLYYISHKMNDSIDFLLFDYYEIAETGKQKRQFFRNNAEIVFNESSKYNKEWLLEAFAGHYTEYVINRPLIGGVWGKAYRRSIIMKNHLKFPQGVGICEDMLFNVRYCAIAKRIVYEKIALYNYYINKNSASHYITEKKWDEFILGMYNANVAMMLSKHYLPDRIANAISDYFRMYLIQIVLWRIPRIHSDLSIAKGKMFCIEQAKSIDHLQNLSITEKYILGCCKAGKMRVLCTFIRIAEYTRKEM